MSRKFFINDTDYATENTAGVVKVGSGLKVDGNGILKVIGEGGVNYQDLVELVVPTITLSGLKYPTILEDNNYTVTFTCDDKVIKKRTNGEDTMKVDAPKLGTWTATCKPDRYRAYSTSVKVAALGNSYSMSMSMNIYDIIRPSGSTLSNKKKNLAATAIGNYAVFAGGGSSGVNVKYSTVDCYDSNLVKTSASDLSKERDNLAATTIGDYALFGGGRYYTNDSHSCPTVDAYSSDLVRTSAPDLSNSRGGLAATTIGDYALFGGGYNNSTRVATVDAYSSDLIKVSSNSLAGQRSYLAATTIADYALFGGGDTNSSNLSNEIDFLRSIDTLPPVEE